MRPSAWTAYVPATRVVATGVSGSPDSCTLTSSPATEPVDRATGSGSHTPSLDPGACETTTRSLAGSTTPNSRTGAGSPPSGPVTTGPTGL